jgi:iron complex transport system ATP-binding protein
MVELPTGRRLCDDRLPHERGITTLVTLYDLNLAGRHADHAVVLQRGSIYDAGTPDRVLRPTMLRDVYSVHADVVPGAGGASLVQAIASVRNRDPAPAGQPT